MFCNVRRYPTPAWPPFGLLRNPLPAARQAVREALLDMDETVRQAALNSVSLWRDREAVPQLLCLLTKPSLPNQRAAAEALGRLGERLAVPALLAAAGNTADRIVQHSITYALIEIGDGEGTSAGLTSQNPATRRTALVALDQMENGHLQPAAVTRELSSTEPALKETAWWIAGRHPEWSAQLSGFLRARLGEAKASAAEREDLLQQLARLAKAPAIQALLSEQVGGNAPDAARLALQAMARAALPVAPPEWLAVLSKAAANPQLATDAVTTARAVSWGKARPKELVSALKKLGMDSAQPAEVRLKALAALPDGPATLDEELFSFLREHLKTDRPAIERSLAADVFSRAQLTQPQLLALAGFLKDTGPMELERLLEAFTRSTADQVGQRLLEALDSPGLRSAVRPDSLKSRLAKYSPLVRKQAQAFYLSLNADAEKQKARLEDLLRTLPSGDIRRGQAVFNNPKAACATCHAIGYLGGKVGPDLTRIGGIRTERDLLEAILFPSASFVRGYEPVVVVLKTGKSYNGIVRRDTPDELVLLLGADQEVRLPRNDIEEMQPSHISVMPSGLDQQLTRQDTRRLGGVSQGVQVVGCTRFEPRGMRLAKVWSHGRPPPQRCAVAGEA